MFQAFLEVFHLGRRDLVLLLGLVVGLVEFGQLFLELFVALCASLSVALPSHAGGHRTEPQRHSRPSGNDGPCANRVQGCETRNRCLSPNIRPPPQASEKTPVARCDGTGKGSADTLGEEDLSRPDCCGGLCSRKRTGAEQSATAHRALAPL